VLCPACSLCTFRLRVDADASLHAGDIRGLLIAVPEKKLEEFTTLFDGEGQSYWVVGRVVEGKGIEVSEQGQPKVAGK